MMGGDGTEEAAESFADEDGHVGGVEAGEGLADGEHLDELFVVEPVEVGDERSAEIGDGAAEAGGADFEELHEDVEQGDAGAGDGGGRDGREGFCGGVTHRSSFR